MNLGHFARHDYVDGRTENGFQIGKCLQDAVRRFVKDQRARGLTALRFSGQCFKTASPRTGLLRQKAYKVKLIRGQPGNYHALSAALAPGMGITLTPASMAAATSWLPGSLMPGVPAWEIPAIRPPVFESQSIQPRADARCVGGN